MLSFFGSFSWSEKWSEIRPPRAADAETPLRRRLGRAGRAGIGWLPLWIAISALLFGLAELGEQRSGEPVAWIEADASIPISRTHPALIDINRASAAELATLPRVGDLRAQRIVEQRAQRPFRSLMDLVERGLLRPTELAAVAELARVYVSAD